MKSSIKTRLTEIRSLTKNPTEIRKLLTTSDETFTEALGDALGKGIAASVGLVSHEDINWNIDAKIDHAKQHLERLYKNNKDLPDKFDTPISILDSLLKPLESQLEWYERNPLTDGVAKAAGTVRNFGVSLISKKDKQ